MLHFSVLWTLKYESLVGQLTVTTNSPPSWLLSCQFLAIFRTSLTILTISWQYFLLIIPGSLKQVKISIQNIKCNIFLPKFILRQWFEGFAINVQCTHCHCQLDAARILTFDENQERQWCISENVFSHVIYIFVFCKQSKICIFFLACVISWETKTVFS